MALVSKQVGSVIAKTFALLCLGRVATCAVPAGPNDPLPERFVYSGHVIDERGEPVAGAEIVATHRSATDGYGYIAQTKSKADGQFTIDTDRALSGASRPKIGDDRIRIAVTHDNFLYGRVEDLQTFSAERCVTLRVELKDGRALRGRVVDAAGKGVAKALVQAEFPEESDGRKASTTDAQGSFELKGLPRRDVNLQVLANDPAAPAQSGRAAVEAYDEKLVEVRVEPIVLPADKVVHVVLGMNLVDGDPKLNAAFHHAAQAGIVVMDAGADPARLDIGDVQRGDLFWLAGDTKVKTVAEFKERLVAEKEPSPTEKGAYVCRVVYSFSRRGFSGSNTQYVRLTEGDVAALRGDTK